jgi:hypothetical protein
MFNFIYLLCNMPLRASHDFMWVSIVTGFNTGGKNYKQAGIWYVGVHCGIFLGDFHEYSD